MKTKILSLLFLGILTTVFVYADETENATKSQNKAMGNYIMSHIDYPDFAIENKIEAEIRISMTVNLDGSVSVLQANCVEKELLDYFLAELNKIEFDSDMAKEGKVYSFIYTFKLH